MNSSGTNICSRLLIFGVLALCILAYWASLGGGYLFDDHYNLVDNAVRHGGTIRAVRFSLENQNGDRIIVCADDGDGVAAHEKEKIFDLGFGKNTGFGLAISREILAITGITIRETGKPGTGARFELVVPKEGVLSPGSGKK